MIHLSCDNCVFRNDNICTFYSKNVTVIKNGKKEKEQTVLNIQSDWYCKNFQENMCIEGVTELNRELEKDF